MKSNGIVYSTGWGTGEALWKIGIVEWGLGFGSDRWDLDRCNLHSLRQILTLPIPPYNRFVTHKVRYAYVLLEV